MKNFVAKSCVVLLSCAVSIGIAIASPVKIGVAAEPSPPFFSPDSTGKWSGWEIDFIEAVCAQEKLQCEIVPVSWDGLIPALTTGKIDLIVASMFITKDRKKIIDFSDKYYESPPAIVGQKDQKFDATTAGLSGKVIGVQVSTKHGVYAKKHFTKSEVKEYQTVDERNQDLSSGRIDAALDNLFLLQDYLKTDSGKACCEIKSGFIPDPDVYGEGVGAGMRKGDTDLKNKINDGIKTLRANGKYAEITKKYFSFDIYGAH